VEVQRACPTRNYFLPKPTTDVFFDQGLIKEAQSIYGIFISKSISSFPEVPSIS
jgi:hypothetical protein